MIQLKQCIHGIYRFFFLTLPFHSSFSSSFRFNHHATSHCYEKLLSYFFYIDFSTSGLSLYAEVVHFVHERKRKINSKCRQIKLTAKFVWYVLRRYQMMIIKCYLSQKCRGAEKNVEQNVGYLLTTTTNAEQFRLIYTNTCVDEWKLLKNVIVNNNLYIVYILVDAVL